MRKTNADEEINLRCFLTDLVLNKQARFIEFTKFYKMFGREKSNILFFNHKKIKGDLPQVEEHRQWSHPMIKGKLSLFFDQVFCVFFFFSFGSGVKMF